jgi:glycosyltransferase involved in cell wall biosynthesis
VAGAADARIFPRTDGLPSSIRLLGFVDDADLGVLYKHAAWFVLPSLYEGFGLPAIEAMANGCPVLAARAGSLPEVCGDAAIYFDPRVPASLAQVLGQVAGQPELRATMVARHAERLAHYTWRHNALIVGRELRRLIDGPHAGAVAEAADPALADTRLEGVVQ